MNHYVEKANRKRILFLCDDPRLQSGVGTMAREIILGTCGVFNYHVLGGAVSHPERDSRTDMSQEYASLSGIHDASVFIDGVDGYGTQDHVRRILATCDIDAIVHFTDPRQWIWLYHMEREIRQQVPLIYYHVWDNDPYPMYNRSYYDSCDAVLCISKLTENMVRQVSSNLSGEQIRYVPHGINDTSFYPITKDKPGKVLTIDKRTVTEFAYMEGIKRRMFGGQKPSFVVLYNSRNIRRKSTSDVLYAFELFYRSLDDAGKASVALIMHTDTVDANGTDLNAVREDLCCDSKACVYFSSTKIDTAHLNYFYNVADVTMNLAYNEGFGLTTAESLMAGTPIIATTTGGLQDQFRFCDDESKVHPFTTEWATNSAYGPHTTHGYSPAKGCKWGIPLPVVSRTLGGSPPTPYIFEDHTDINDAVDALISMYRLKTKDLEMFGIWQTNARTWMQSEESGMSAKEMCSRWIDAVKYTLDTWTPRKSKDLIKAI